jgi:hypothetical protein
MHEQWGAFFLGEAGAAAALTGLFFVAISINLRQILGEPVLTGRAGETIAMLTGSLITASMMLVPLQDEPWLGVELGIVAIVTWVVPVRVQLSARRELTGTSRRTFPERVLLTQLATVPAIVAASLLAAGWSSGYAVLAVGILITFVVSILNAWVLLVEILR